MIDGVVFYNHDGTESVTATAANFAGKTFTISGEKLCNTAAPAPGPEPQLVPPSDDGNEVAIYRSIAALLAAICAIAVRKH